jgi:hypothetical protein
MFSKEPRPMSPQEWLNQGSPKAVAAALAVAVFAGLGAGAWLKLPAYLAEPIMQGSPQMILADDPGRAKWNQVVASLGGLGATFVVPASFAAPPPAPVFAPDLEAQLAATNAEIDAELRRSEARMAALRMAWEERAPRRYAYAEPVGYAEPVYWPPRDAPPVYADEGFAPERPTFEAEEPVPPPPPRPSDW